MILLSLGINEHATFNILVLKSPEDCHKLVFFVNWFKFEFKFAVLVKKVRNGMATLPFEDVLVPQNLGVILTLEIEHQKL